MNKTVLLQFSGPDQPGLIAVLTRLLADYNACILDIGQSVIHETLVLGLLVEIAPARLAAFQSESIFRAIAASSPSIWTRP